MTFQCNIVGKCSNNEYKKSGICPQGMYVSTFFHQIIRDQQVKVLQKQALDFYRLHIGRILKRED